MKENIKYALGIVASLAFWVVVLFPNVIGMPTHDDETTTVCTAAVPYTTDCEGR